MTTKHAEEGLMNRLGPPPSTGERAIQAVRARLSHEAVQKHATRVDRALRMFARFEAFCAYHGLDVDTALDAFTPPLPAKDDEDGTLGHVANGDTSKNGG